MDVKTLIINGVKYTDIAVNNTRGADLVVGDDITFRESVYKYSPYSRKSKFLGERLVAAIILRESYGDKKQQHTFTLEVTGSLGYEAIPEGTIIRRKGRNLYDYLIYWQPAIDSERAKRAEDKHIRGTNARKNREIRLQLQYNSQGTEQ